MWLSCNKVVRANYLIVKRNSRMTCADDAARDGDERIFAPKFGSDGLLTAVVTDAASGRVLMVAHMDAEALQMTRETGLAHFHSRSRGALWMKGETSGNRLRVQRILVDCDQDALVLEATPAGPTCHTGAPSCFYRRLDGEILARVET
jgi:phosphoribosyl-AMP cyclohydrolase